MRSKTRQRPVWVLSALMALVMLMGACSSPTGGETTSVSEDASAPTTGGDTGGPASTVGQSDEVGGPSGTLTVAQQQILPRPDPYALTTNMEHSISLAMFDPLSRVDEEGVLTMYLAESYEPESETSWLVHLKQGVMWSDGTEFTADDVVFTIERMQNPDLGSIWTAVYSYIESAEAVDTYTVRITTTRQVVNLPADYGRMSMMPKAPLEAMGEDAFFENPVTSGPFKFKEMVPGERLVLEAYEDYHLGAPKVETLIFKQVPDAVTRVAEATTGASDIVFDIPPTEIETVNNSDEAQVVAYPGVGRIMVEFAIATTPELEDPRVRQAVFLAIDADAINAAIYDGAGGSQTGWLDKHTFGKNDALSSHGYDPERAQELLAEAGYPDGLSIPFTIRTPDGLLTEDVGLIINEMLNAAGFKTEFTVMDAAAFVTATNKEGTLTGIYMRGSRNSTGDPDQILRAYDPKREDKFLSDEKLEAMIDAQASESDPELRAELVAEIDAYLHESFLGYNVVTWPGIEAVNNRVSGFVPSPFEVRSFFNVSVSG